jgi:hypothetical protein
MINNDPHWASQYIGNPWQPLGRGPSAFDCWGLCWWVERTHYGREMDPLVVNPIDLNKVEATIYTQLDTGNWIELEKPMDGAIMAMSKLPQVTHVGVYLELDRGVALHALERKGVLCQRVSALRGLGFTTLKYYFHKTWKQT